MALISNGEFVTDEWRRLADEEALPEKGKIIVSQDRLDNALKAPRANGDIGVIIDNTLEIDKLTPVLAKLGLIAITFPTFADGRGFSLARLIRMYPWCTQRQHTLRGTSAGTEHWAGSQSTDLHGERLLEQL